MCQRLSRDQPQPGSLFQRPREAEKRDPGNEVGTSSPPRKIQNGGQSKHFLHVEYLHKIMQTVLELKVSMMEIEIFCKLKQNESGGVRRTHKMGCFGAKCQV